ncbi:MAG: helix-turn-helix transcriptional regulator [Phycisphaerae bacterium]|nr:helix-turn-helix transcriptional regulator [Phycisphaerae bacterium]
MNNSQKNNNFSGRLRIIRKKRGLSSADFAKKLNLSNPSQISRYESSKSFPNVPALEKIAEILDIDLHWLITGKLSPGTTEAVKALKPFVYSYLSTITNKIQEIEERRTKIRQQTTEAVMHNLPVGVEQTQAFLNLEKEQKKIEDLHAEYKAVTDAINEALKPFGEKI